MSQFKLLIVLTFLGLWTVVCEPFGAEAAPRPNFVFILADDLGFADAGYQPDKNLDLEGTNVWPQITGERPAASRIFYWKTGEQLALRRGDWKLITDTRGRNAQLYNIAEDPLESTDLASRYPQRVEELQKTLDTQRRRDP